MNETDARRLLQATYFASNPSDLAWRRWLETPSPRPRPRRALLAALIAACVALAVAVPVGITLALHRQSVPAGPIHSPFAPGTECQAGADSVAPHVTRIEFDRQSGAVGTFTFPAAVHITDSQRVTTFMSAVCALQSETPGVYHCAASTTPFVGYTTTLFAGDQPFPPVTITAFTCPQVGGLGGDGYRLVMNASFWSSIGNALGIANADEETFNGIPQTRAALTPIPGLPCVVQPETLLTATDLPANLIVQFPPSGRVGGPGLLDNGDAAYPGYVGRSTASFQWSGFDPGPVGSNGTQTSPSLPTGGELYTSTPGQVLQLSEEASDWGSVANAERWMMSQHQEHQPNDIANTRNGVEVNPTVASLGDDTLVYQIDEGAPPSSQPFTGPFVGHVYTGIEVRQGELIFAISIDSGPTLDAASLAQTLMTKLIANDAMSCG
jgi:hypothetical protein